MDVAPLPRPVATPLRVEAPTTWWRRARTAMSRGLLAGAVVLMASRFDDMTSAAKRLAGINPGWVVLAAVAEAGSMVVFARLQQLLLRAGGRRTGLPTMAGITLAANAVTGTLPGGIGVAAAWQFDHLGRRGVPRFLRLWMFLVAGGISSFALFVIVATGIETAGSQGPVRVLRWPILVLAAIPVVALVLEVFHTTVPVRRLTRWLGARFGSGRPGHAARR